MRTIFQCSSYSPPWAGATWIITEIEPDDETLFGLCDLGLGEPELGYVSLTELKSLSGPFGLKIERDVSFRTDKPLSVWAEVARRERKIRTPE